jgi:hypothetical protein
MDKDEKKLIEEHALRNAIASFRAKSKTAAIPHVGIFWIDLKGAIHVETVSLRDAEDYDGFKTFTGSHYDLWDKAIKANPQWQGKEYEEVPRGRVVYRKDPKKPEFIIYMPKQIVKFKGKVIGKFDLPAGAVRIDTTDEHYRM